MLSILNFDLLLVGVAIAGVGTLGFSIFFSNTKSWTARAFLFFSIVTIFWSAVNFVSYRLNDPAEILWFIRFVLFFATWHAFSFLLFALQFPVPEPLLPKRWFYALMSWTATMSIIVLTPVVYEAVTSTAPVTTRTGPGIAVFGITVFSYIGTGIFLLGRKWWHARSEDDSRYQFVFLGVLATFFLLIVFDFVFPAFLNVPQLVPLGGLFILPFVLATAYAILKYSLFDLKVASVGFLVFSLATVTLFEILLSGDVTGLIYRSIEFCLVLAFGIMLIKGVVREVEQREQIQKLASDLEETNERQEGLIRFISHEVKNFLTKDLFAFTALMDGDFGSVPDDTRAFVERARGESAGSLASVMDILKASNQKKGTVEYKKETFDLKAEVAAQVEKLSARAKEKGLALAFSADPTEGAYAFTGDKAELGDHVFGNLIENAINYTPAGSVTVTLAKRDGRYVLSVTDTGVGITDEDKARLFTEGGHGRESQRINVHSTGYGLYIAKNIVTAHGGAIRVESGGKGKGSAFTVELPAT